MKHTDGGKSDGRRSSRASTSARRFMVMTFFAGIAFACATPLLAMVLLLDILGKSLSGSLAAFFGQFYAGIADMAWAALSLMAYAIWLILGFEWGQLGWLLLTILGWLLSADLP